MEVTGKSDHWVPESFIHFLAFFGKSCSPQLLQDGDRGSHVGLEGELREWTMLHIIGSGWDFRSVSRVHFG
jgi:hypothetical protein